MIFAIWALAWICSATMPQMLLIPLVATLVRSRLLQRSLFPTGRRTAVFVLAIIPATIFGAARLGGADTHKAFVDAVRIPVAALCLNHVVLALVNIDIRQFFATSAGVSQWRLLRRIRNACGIFVLVFDRSIDIHGRHIKAIIRSASARLRVTTSLRSRVRICRLAVVAITAEIIRLIGEFWRLIATGGPTPDLALWAVAGTGARPRPVADLSLLVLPLIGLWLTAPHAVPETLRDMLIWLRLGLSG